MFNALNILLIQWNELNSTQYYDDVELMFDGRRASKRKDIVHNFDGRIRAECCVFRLITIHEVHLFAFLRNKFWFACIIRVTDFAVLGERRECARESGTNEKCFASKFNLINPYYEEVKLKLHQYTVVIMGPIQLTSHTRRNGRDRRRTRRFVIPLYVLCLWRHFKEIPIRI